MTVRRKPGPKKAKPHGPQSARSQQRVLHKQRQAQALALRLAGENFEQISAALGYKTRSAAYKLVESALAEMIREPAEAVRQQELARLDKLLLSIWQQATTPGPGQMAAQDRVYKNMVQRCFYVTGLKVPERIAPTTPDGEHAYAGMGLAALLLEAEQFLAPSLEVPRASRNGDPVSHSHC